MRWLLTTTIRLRFDRATTIDDLRFDRTYAYLRVWAAALRPGQRDCG